MHSIMLTNKCNNNCIYCFAKNAYNYCSDFISMKNFIYALDFIANSFNSVGIIGGEPTLHPNFREILELIIKDTRIKSSVIYTNAYKIADFLDLINNEKFTLLINCNSPSDIGREGYNNFRNNVIECSRKLSDSRFRLGFNLYKPNQNYSFLINLLQETKQKNLRFAISVPSFLNEESIDIIDFHKQIKKTMLEIFEHLQAINVTPHFDCNAFPNCLLNENDKLFFKQIQEKAKQNGIKTELINNKQICTPQLVIKPDLSVIRCFASADYQKVNIKEFKNAIDLYQHFYLNLDVFQNITFHRKECINCKYKLINCNVCPGYNTKKTDRIRQYCLQEAGV